MADRKMVARKVDVTDIFKGAVVNIYANVYDCCSQTCKECEWDYPTLDKIIIVKEYFGYDGAFSLMAGFESLETENEAMVREVMEEQQRRNREKHIVRRAERDARVLRRMKERYTAEEWEQLQQSFTNFRE